MRLPLEKLKIKGSGARNDNYDFGMRNDAGDGDTGKNIRQIRLLNTKRSVQENNLTLNTSPKSNVGGGEELPAGDRRMASTLNGDNSFVF